MTLRQRFLERPIAHRGLHDAGAGRPENGLSAIQVAVDAGYGVEIDLQLSADGVPMVFHDHELERMTGVRGEISDMPAEDLVQIPLRGTDRPIPTLHAALQVVEGRVPLLIEIKDQSRVMGEVDGVLERAVAEMLDHYAGPVAVMSFNPHSVAVMAEAAPDVTRGLVTGGYDHPAWAPLGEARLEQLRAIADFGRVGASFISHDKDDLDDQAVQELRARGVPVLCWTVTSPEEADDVRGKADNITFEGFRP